MLNVTAMNNGVNMPSHHGGPWPLPNVIEGVSVEDLDTGIERLDWLRKTLATRRVMSYEPALGSIYRLFYRLSDMDWVICGAETGPGARPMDLDWARSTRDQCLAAGVPFFFKRDSRGNRELDGRIHEEVPW